MAEDQCSTSSYAFLVNSSTISQSIKCQELVILSTTESEYVVATHTTKETLQLHSFIFEIFDKKLETMTIFSDNQSIIVLTQDQQFHAHTKHINICYYFIYQTIKEDKMCLVYYLTKKMVANVFTKTLLLPKVKYFATEFELSTI